MDSELESIIQSLDANALGDWLDRLQQQFKSLEGQFLSMEFDLRELRRKLPD